MTKKQPKNISIKLQKLQDLQIETYDQGRPSLIDGGNNQIFEGNPGSGSHFRDQSFFERRSSDML